jgi:O-antigen/teichoic acid export membrane protein/SAM-dependent methyltransferase
MQTKRSFLSNSFSGYIGYLVDFSSKLIVYRIILDSLGVSLLGVWAILKLITLFPLFLQQGLFFAVFIKTSREKDPMKFAGEAFSLSAAIGAGVMLLFLVFAPQIASFFNIPPEHRQLATTGLRLSAVAYLLSSISQIFLHLLLGLSRFDLSNAVQIPLTLAASLAAIFVVHRGNGILALILVDVSFAFALAITSWVVCTKMIGRNPLVFSFDASKIFSLFKEASSQLLLNASGRLLWETDGFLISKVFGITSMAPYWIARRIPYTWADLLWAGSWPAVPEAAGDDYQSGARLKKIHWVHVSLMIPVGFFLWFQAENILSIWLGQEDSFAAAWMQILILAIGIDLFPATLVSLLFARNQTKTAAKILALAAVIKVVLSLFFVSTGVETLLWTTVLGSLVFCLTILVVAASRMNQTAMSLLMVAVPSLVASGISAIAARYFLVSDSFIGLAVHAIVFLLSAFVLTLFFTRLLFREVYGELIRYLITSSNFFYKFYVPLYSLKRRFLLRRERDRSMRESRFERVYENPDPWNYKTSEYEITKYEESVRMLNGRTFSLAVELGCSEGAFTRRLSRICEKVIACDISERALKRAEQESAEFSNISFEKLDIILDPIPGGADLICCGEILNCLVSQEHLKIVRNRIIQALNTGGLLLLVNLHLLPDDRKGIWLGDLGFGSTQIRDAFLESKGLRVVEELDRPLYRITLLQKTES